MSFFSQNHPNGQGEGSARGYEMPAEQLVTGPPPEISLGLSVQEFSLNDTSHHHQVPVGTIYPPPIISIEASIEGEDPETLLRHTMTRHDIEQPPQETNQKKSLYGSSATHTFNNTLPEIHAAEPNNEISIFFPQSVAVGFADYFAGSNGLGSAAHSVPPEVKEEPRASISAASSSEENIAERVNQSTSTVNLRPRQEGGPERVCSSVGGYHDTSATPARFGPSFDSLRNTTNNSAEFLQGHVPLITGNPLQQPVAAAAAEYTAALNLEDLWVALLTARANDLNIASSELTVAVTRFLEAKELPELQGFDFVLSVHRRKQLLVFCDLYPKAHSEVSDIHSGGTDGEKGLCFAALASLRSKLKPTSWVDINARLLQESRSHLQHALRNYFAAKVWDPELALGLVIMGTVFAVRSHWQDDQTRNELTVLIRWSLQMSYEQCELAKAAGTPQNLYIFYHVNFAAVILDTYLGQQHRILKANPDHFVAHQKALSDAHRDISPMGLIGRDAEVLFLVRRVEASLYHNYWKQSEAWDSNATANLNLGLVNLRPIAEAFRVSQLTEPHF